VFAIFDTLSVDEYFAWDDLRAHGVPISEIHGGNEPIAMFETAYMTDVHQRRRMVYGAADSRRFVIAFHPLPGRRIAATYPFRGWLGLHEGEIYVLESMAH